MGQIHLISGPERRRRWSEEQKRAIVSAAFAPGAVVADVARRADVCANQIYRWRRDLCMLSPGFAEVVVAEGAPVMASSAIELDLAGVGRVRIPSDIPPDLAGAVVSALTRR